MADDLRRVSLIEVLESAWGKLAANLRVMLPARVESYDVSRQVVRAQPMVGSIFVDSDGVEHEHLYPAVVEAPVEWPGAGGARLTFPVNPGDFGMLVFADNSLDEWKVNRGAQPVVAKDLRVHALTDGVFRPGLRPTPWPGVRSDAVTLGFANESGTGTQLHITPTGIALGSPTPEYAVALAEKVTAELVKLRQALTTWNPTGTLADAAALKTLLVNAGIATPGSTWGTALGSATVKVEG